MRPTTTIEIYRDDLRMWRRWCKTKGLTSPEMMRKIVDAAKAKKVQEIYSSLPKPEKTSKPLSGKRIKKKYKK